MPPYSGRMPEEPPDFKAFAGRYFDLWQSQVAALAANPALAEALLAMTRAPQPPGAPDALLARIAALEARVALLEAKSNKPPRPRNKRPAP